ncbi:MULTISPECIES: hypothetical protein [Pseudanabaena]|jgi:hypothetical protein|uniref:hypothetical protein n=1 Tax=Pseudanabaena TaxID=1152 RepID=UPI0024789F7D|nr:MULTISPECIES: hypothetical protein [Pseudanabaena]WGS70369.1 hypothetical protein OA858_11560 [Pseudanabaena galeata CCNP1313]
MMTNYRPPKRWLYPIGKLSKLAAAIALAAFAYIPTSAKAETYINNRTCPADFPSLSKALAKDLPDYLNRVYSRLRIKREVMTISQPELEPLPLAPDQPRDRLPQQIFLSILERQSGRTETSQRAYWLFLVPTSNGWRLAIAFMRVGQAPPVDVSDAAIADAANKWLRDYCDPRYKL